MAGKLFSHGDDVASGANAAANVAEGVSDATKGADKVSSGAKVETSREAKNVGEMAKDLAGKSGQSRVSATTAGGKKVDIDLQGKGHFDKATGQKIETPHVHEAKISVGPNGKVNLSDKTTRPATKQDIRTA